MPAAGDAAGRGEDAPARRRLPRPRRRRRRRRRRRASGCRAGSGCSPPRRGAATAGLVTFGVISYHLTRDHVVPLAGVPVVYAAAMAAAAVAALVTGWLYDRWNAAVLLALPVLVAAVPPLAFSGTLVPAVAGVLVWGAAVGVQDSTVKALVAELVPPPRRATAYGMFAAVQGGAAVLGGTMAGALSSRSVPALVAAVAVTQVVTLVLLVATLRRTTA